MHGYVGRSINYREPRPKKCDFQTAYNVENKQGGFRYLIFSTDYSEGYWSVDLSEVDFWASKGALRVAGKHLKQFSDLDAAFMATRMRYATGWTKT